MYRAITILKLDFTGMTLKARFMQGNSQVGGWITTTFIPLPNAEYEWDYSNFPANFRGRVEIWNALTDTYITSLAINPQEYENTDVKTSSIQPKQPKNLILNQREIRLP